MFAAAFEEDLNSEPVMWLLVAGSIERESLEAGAGEMDCLLLRMFVEDVAAREVGDKIALIELYR